MIVRPRPWPGLLLALLAALPGCDRLPGRPVRGEEKVRPDRVTSFGTLYATNCAGCHGDDGRMGAAQPMNNPLYLAVVSDDDLARVIAQGVADSMMPAFDISWGGPLTDEQITLLVAGMRQRWATPRQTYPLIHRGRGPSFQIPAAAP